eukprot:15178400-Alexandrium_andersonii.AAC.1
MMLLAALADMGYKGISLNHFTVYAGCDVARESRKSMMASDTVQHVFPDILAQVPEEHAAALRALRPGSHEEPST